MSVSTFSVPLNAQFQLGTATENVTVTTDTLAPIETEDTQVSNPWTRHERLFPANNANPFEVGGAVAGTAWRTIRWVGERRANATTISSRWRRQQRYFSA
jgi:hypothetical protein